MFPVNLPIDQFKTMLCQNLTLQEKFKFPKLTLDATLWYNQASGIDYLVITVPRLVQGGSHDRLQR
jgi:hypothetical protein